MMYIMGLGFRVLECIYIYMQEDFPEEKNSKV